MRKFFLLIVGLSIVVSSCSNFIASELFRTYDDPSDVTPNVDSFREEGVIYIDWQEDKAADSYVLLRAEDSRNPRYEEVYCGNGFSYVDRDCEVTKKYLYLLGKTRGQRLFLGQKTQYGYCSNKRRDIYDNHKKGNAKRIEYELNGLNVYYGLFSDGHKFFEEDWYEVKVPARCYVIVDCDQIDPIPRAGAASLDLEFLQLTNQYLSTSRDIKIENVSFEEKVIPFCVRAKQENLGSGIVHITYGLKIVEIKPI